MTTTEGTPPQLLLVGGAAPNPLSVDVAVQALAQARARGLRTHVTNQEATVAATPEVSGAADAASAVDFEDPAGSAKWAAARRAEGERFDVALAVREMAQVAAAGRAAGGGRHPRAGTDPPRHP
ncbi:hypothetical protein ABZ391_12945, partial [Kitasatospora cineracea]